MRHFRRDATLVGLVGIAGAAAFSGSDPFNLDQTLSVPNGNSYAANDFSEYEKRFQQLQASSGDAGRGGTATAGSGDPHSSGDGDAGGGGGGGGSGGVVADAGVNRSEPLTASRARPTARSQRNPYTPQYDFRRANRCYGVVACRLGFIFRS